MRSAQVRLDVLPFRNDLTTTYSSHFELRNSPYLMIAASNMIITITVGQIASPNLFENNSEIILDKETR